MRLYEEFKEYETLWEEVKADPIDDILWNTPDIKLDYDGFEVDECEDHFDPNSYYGHYQTFSTRNIPDFTYEVDAVTMFEVLRDDILPKNKSKVNAPLVDTYKELEEILEASSKESEEAALQELELFLAKNLEKFVDLFLDDITEHFAEAAEEYAHKNL